MHFWKRVKTMTNSDISITGFSEATFCSESYNTGVVEYIVGIALAVSKHNGNMRYLGVGDLITNNEEIIYGTGSSAVIRQLN